MTPKQRRFASLVIEGRNPSEAYRGAYGAESMKPNAVASEASKLMKHPDISKCIEKGIEESTRKAVWSREIAKERLSEVNGACYEAIVGGSLDRATLSGFMETADRLNTLANVKAETAEDYERRFNTKEKALEREKRKIDASNAAVEAMFI